MVLDQWSITYVLSHTIFQLSLSIFQIIASDEGVPPVNASVLKYRHKSYTATN